VCDGHIVLSSAGHPPAMVVSSKGETREAPATGPLLGAFTDSHWPVQMLPVHADELILLYTDGLTETAGPRQRFGLARLRALVSEHASATHNDLLEQLTFSRGRRADDIAAPALRPRSGN
jgi:serine phosphatase RsbU (regulator of sigma subunit)